MPNVINISSRCILLKSAVPDIMRLMINMEEKIILSDTVDSRRSFYLKGGDNITILAPLRPKRAIEPYY